MTDKAYAVPLHELLAGVPRDTRLEITDPDGYGTRFIPVGRYCHEAAESLRAALAQPEPDYRDVVIKGDSWRVEFLPNNDANVVLVKANYKTQPEKTDMQIGLTYEEANPPQREWVGLTDDEYIQLLDKAEKDAPKTGSVFKNLWYAINTKLKEKNND
jgi:hypothetical protein